MRRPVTPPYEITSEHGEYVGSLAWFGKHSGVDYAVPSGTAVSAPAGGEIQFAAFDPIGGHMIVLFDGQYYHRLMHNSKLHVKQWQRVQEGDLLADSGSTGLSSGPHVHWDICRKYRAEAFEDFIDPADWLKEGNKDTKGVIVLNDNGIKNMYVGFLRREATEEDIKYWTGKPYDVLQAALMNTSAFAEINDLVGIGRKARDSKEAEFVPFTDQLYIKRS